MDWGDHTKFTWKNKGRKEFKVDVSCEFVRVDEESVGVTVSIPIPRCCIRVIGIGEGPDLLASISQLSGYFTMLTPRLSYCKISELLQCQGSGHLYYHGDGVLLE